MNKINGIYDRSGNFGIIKCLVIKEATLDTVLLNFIDTLIE
jgi:hypothetical protein